MFSMLKIKDDENEKLQRKTKFHTIINILIFFK